MPGPLQVMGSRSITLAAKLERLVASYETGVLTLRILVAESAKPRKVRITEGADERTIDVQGSA
jgi:HSP20 family protein